MATRKIETSLTLTGEKEFNSEMKAVNSNLKTLRTEQKEVESSFKGSGNEMSKNISLTRNLTEQNKQQTEVIRAANIALQQNIAKYGEDSKQADHYRQIIAKARTEINKNNKEIEKHSVALKNAKSAGAAAEKIIKSVGSAAGSAAKGLGSMSAAAAGLTAGLTAAAAAAGMAAIKVMASYAKESAEAAKKASEAGEALTDNQKQWLEYSNSLDGLDSAIAGANSALGGMLLPVLGDLSAKSAAFLNDFSAAMDGAAGDSKKQGKVIAEYLKKGAVQIKEALPAYVQVGKDLLAGLGEGIAEVGPDILDIGLDLVMDLLDGIIAYAPNIADAGIVLIEKLTNSLIERGPDMLSSAANLITSLVSGLAQAAPKLIPMAFQLVKQLITSLIEASPDLLVAGLELIYGIIAGITDGLGEFISSAGDIIDTLVNAFTAAWPRIQEIGGNIVQGIWNGISGAGAWLYGKLQGWVGDVLSWIKGFLGIESPSKVMRDQVGKYMAQGIGVGFEAEMAKVNRQIQGSINTSFDIPTPDVPGFGRSYVNQSTGKVVNLYFYAKQITEADMAMVVDTVNRELGGMTA